MGLVQQPKKARTVFCGRCKDNDEEDSRNLETSKITKTMMPQSKDEHGLMYTRNI